MMAEKIKKIRCAIYTRKSVEDEGGRKEFNSNDAQREAGEAYIASQKGNGWICLPNRYDDYGYSGGNMNRPGLKQLLADAENGLIDVIVVYKIDRLSRSICDFAELSKKFDEWNISFTSVTQEINTSTSAGRMMLNILMTFASYERDVIRERVAWKLAASRKKGKWVGGSVAMGYKVVNKKLVIEPAEAEVIRHIFQRFIEIQSPKQIAAELNRDGIKTKQGKTWDTGHIYRILENHTYIGEVKYKGTICEGEHDAIIAIDVWNRTREILATNNRTPDRSRNTEIVAPLKGILKCGHCGCAMMPTYARKNGKQYFYYLCAKDSKRGENNCPVHQIAAGEIEKAVREQLQKFLQSPTITMHLAQVLNIPGADIAEAFQTNFWEEITPGEINRLTALLIERVTIFEDKLSVELKSSGVKTLIEEFSHAEE